MTKALWHRRRTIIGVLRIKRSVAWTSPAPRSFLMRVSGWAKDLIGLLWQKSIAPLWGAPLGVGIAERDAADRCIGLAPGYLRGDYGCFPGG